MYLKCIIRLAMYLKCIIRLVMYLKMYNSTLFLQPMYFTNWARREPKWGKLYTAYCLLLVKNAQWEAEDCSRLKPSICEYTGKKFIRFGLIDIAIVLETTTFHATPFFFYRCVHASLRGSVYWSVNCTLRCIVVPPLF